MNLKKKNISIIGLGDSGYWSAKLASLLGANVFVSDSEENINEDYIQDLTNLNIKVELRRENYLNNLCHLLEVYRIFIRSN